MSDQHGLIDNEITSIESFDPAALAARQSTVDHIRSEEAYRSILNNVSYLVFEIDELGQILYTNAHIEPLTGHPAEDILSTNIYDLMHIKDKPGFSDRLNKAQNSDNGTPIKCKILTTDQRYIQLSGNTMSYITSEGLDRYVLTLRHRSYKKTFQKQMLRLERYKYITNTVAGVTHDFNNFMTAIKANIDMAEIELKAKTTKDTILNRLSTYLKNAQHASDKAIDLSKNLSNIIKGNKKSEQGPIYLKDLLEEASRICNTSTMFEIKHDIPDNLHIVNGDSTQLTRVFSNLIINATQSMPDGGTIQISAENTELENKNPYGLDPGQYVSVSVSDEGVGIPKENLDKVFNPYFTTRSEGTGLGLANCKEIIEKHRGNIWADSQLGVGTTFHTNLPSMRLR